MDGRLSSLFSLAVAVAVTVAAVVVVVVEAKVLLPLVPWGDRL